ncbi:MAG TPA: hypothetical protein DC017_10830 [Candidatus Wallbacteria bacterium]|nr:hypothetical protein [Candidatus Wallbacteria bacterium]
MRPLQKLAEKLKDIAINADNQKILSKISAIDINSFEVIEGDLPNKALLLVREWMKINRKDLLEIWNTQQFRELPPLV